MRNRWLTQYSLDFISSVWHQLQHVLWSRYWQPVGVYLTGFLLLCSLTGVALWITTSWLTHQLLSSPGMLAISLKASSYPQTQLEISCAIASIETTIDRRNKLADIRLLVAHPALKELELELPLDNSQAIETALSEKLSLPVTTVHQLAKYRFEN